MKPAPELAHYISINVLLARLNAIGPTFTASQAARLLVWPVGDMARQLHRLRSENLVRLQHHGDTITAPYELTPRGKRRAESLLPPDQREHHTPSLRDRILQTLSQQAATADTTLAKQLHITVEELDRELDKLVATRRVRRSTHCARFMYRRA